MSVTLRDISAACGINICSVSQTLSGSPRAAELSSSTRALILSTAHSLGYCRNELARSMATGKSRIVSVIVNNFSAFPPILDGICSSASEHNLTIKFISLDDAGDLSRSLLSVRQYRSIGLLGVAFAERQLAYLSEHFLPYEIPAVVTNTGITLPDVPVVCTDQQSATLLALEHLYELGHRKIFCIGHNPSRCAVYKSFMQNHSLSYKIFPDAGESNLTELCRLSPDAVFCCNDNLGIVLLQFLYEKRLFVPDYFSVMGFGGLECSATTSPALTTVQEPFFEIGKKMLELLAKKIKGQAVPELTRLPAKLLLRKSTAAPKKIAGNML